MRALTRWCDRHHDTADTHRLAPDYLHSSLFPQPYVPATHPFLYVSTRAAGHLLVTTEQLATALVGAVLHMRM